MEKKIMKYLDVICSQFIFTYTKSSEHFVWWIFLGRIWMVSGLKLIIPVPVSSAESTVIVECLSYM